ncbi:type II toxin-antitoxin system antitoxin SocA domain-containing protein [Nonomuraea pusilla]|uniref:Panacea domain-containing protein n=1 Tax=Nonomuraea pusilla TaxID=46177 RepID=UPI00332AAF3A
MTASAHAIAAAFRHRQAGLGARKLQALLYYAQGHHQAWFSRPLFEDAISTSDSGPVVDALWDDAGDPLGTSAELGEAELNTVGYVLSRYGQLSVEELEDRIHAGEPWQRAAGRAQGSSTRIGAETMRQFFAAQTAKEDDLGLDPAEMKHMLQAAARRRDEPRRTDSLEDIRAWLATRA